MSQPPEDDSLERLLRAARSDAPPAELGERVLEQLEYRARLAAPAAPRPLASRVLPWSVVVVAVAAGAALYLAARSNRDPGIAAEHATAPAGAKSSAPPDSRAATPLVDPCAEAKVAPGLEPMIDDFEDGDDAIQPLEGRAGFWRWAREIDAPGTAPALLPVPRAEATRHNLLALHVKGGQLVDWGATVEFNFRPPCYDASRYVGLSFEARGPGRIYVAPREVSVIPIAEGGTCESECYNPHVLKVDLDSTWRVYQVRWSELRQRGIGKPALNAQRLNGLAFLIRAEDTPYDVWLDDVRFLPP